MAVEKAGQSAAHRGPLPRRSCTMCEPTIYDLGREHYLDLVRTAEAALRHPVRRRPREWKRVVVSPACALMALILGLR